MMQNISHYIKNSKMKVGVLESDTELNTTLVHFQILASEWNTSER